MAMSAPSSSHSVHASPNPNLLSRLPPEIIKMTATFLFLSDMASLSKSDRDSTIQLHDRLFLIWRQRFTHFRKLESDYTDSLQGHARESEATSTMIAPSLLTPKSNRRPAMTPSEAALVQVYDDTLQELGLKQAPTSLKDLTSTPAIQDFPLALVKSIKEFVNLLVLGQAHPREAFERYHHSYATELLSLIRLFLAVLKISRSFEPLANSALQQALHLDSECSSALYQFFRAPAEADSKDGLKLTREQRTFVEHDVSRGQLVKVQAYAGTGKTFSLRAYAEKRPSKTFLYLTFNKSGQLEAERSFSTPITPGGRPNLNVRAQTTHSLAYSLWDRKASTKIGEMYAKTAESLVGDLLPAGKHTQGDLDGKELTANAKAIYVLRTLRAFWASDKNEISIDHVPWVMGQRTNLPALGIAACAKRLWSYILSGKDHKGDQVITPHDAYVKELQIAVAAGKHPNFLKEYDYLLIDEAQDLSDCQAALFLKGVKQSAIIVVGDEHQKLYAFRGATGQPFDDRMFPPSKTFYFTKSFRFGNEVARFASTILGVKSNPPWLTRTAKPHLSGSPLLEDRVSRLKPYNNSTPDLTDGLTAENTTTPTGSIRKHTRLYRTNQRLTLDALHLAGVLPSTDRIFLKTNAKMKANDIVSLLRDAHALKNNKPLPSSSQGKKGALRDFGSWKELLERVDAEGEGDSDTMLQLVVSLTNALVRDNFLDSVDRLESRFCQDEKIATIVMATVHQAKGLEWDNVYMGPDFKPDFFNGSITRTEVRSRFSKDEICCVYVAMTRAKRHLIVSDEVLYWLAAVEGAYRYVLSEEEARCEVCDRPEEVQIIQRHRRLSKDDFLDPVKKSKTSKSTQRTESDDEYEDYLFDDEDEEVDQLDADDDEEEEENSQDLASTSTSIDNLGCCSCLIKTYTENPSKFDDDLLDLLLCIKEIHPDLLSREDSESVTQLTGSGSSSNSTPAPNQMNFADQGSTIQRSKSTRNSYADTPFQRSRDRRNIWNMSFLAFKNCVHKWSAA